MADMIIRLTYAEVQTILLEAIAEHYNLDFTDEDADVTFEIINGHLHQAEVSFTDAEDFEDEGIKHKTGQWNLDFQHDDDRSMRNG